MSTRNGCDWYELWTVTVSQCKKISWLSPGSARVPNIALTLHFPVLTLELKAAAAGKKCLRYNRFSSNLTNLREVSELPQFFGSCLAIRP